MNKRIKLFLAIVSVVVFAAYGLRSVEAAPIVAGDIIKAGGSSVYYVGADGRRYVFPNEKTYFSWYSNFSGVKTVSSAELAALTIGGNVTYRPGVRMIKIQSDPKVYAVSATGVLRWVPDEGAAAAIYGSNWANMIDDISDSFFVNYTVGESISPTRRYDRSLELQNSTSINADKKITQHSVGGNGGSGAVANNNQASNTNTNANTNLNGGSGSSANGQGSNQNVNANANSNANAGSNANANANANTNTNVNANTNTNTNVNVNANTNTNTNANANTNTNANANTNANTNTPPSDAIIAAIDPINARSSVGYNLDFPGDWNDLMPFIDLMKEGREWEGECFSATCDAVSHLDIDANGWPKSMKFKDDPARSYDMISSYFNTRSNVPDAGAQFTVTWAGEGELDFFNVSNLTIDAAAHRATFVFKAENEAIRVMSTDPNGNGNYIRDIKIFRSDREALINSGEIFNPDMIEYLKPFGSLRFMDWMLSNDEEPRDMAWAERPKYSYHTWIRQFADPAHPSSANLTMNGFPAEVLVALLNKTGKDGHFNMPYRYTDDYVRSYATYVRDHLAVNLVATFEYSNEIWNWGFPQAGYANEKGHALWPNEGDAWVQYMGVRASNMGKIVKEIFAGQTQRVRVVIAPQTGWADLAPASLDCPSYVAMDPANNKPCHYYADAIAITGYIGDGINEHRSVIEGWIEEGQATALDRLFTQLASGGAPGMPEAGSSDFSVAYNSALWEQFKGYGQSRTNSEGEHLDVYMYEGGLGIGDPGGAVGELFAAAAHDARMKTLYTQFLNAWKTAGGTISNLWGWINPTSSWANITKLGTYTHPKYRAISDFVASTPCWWARCDRSAR